MTTTPLSIPYATHPAARSAPLRTLFLSVATGAFAGLLFGTLECYAHVIPQEYLMAPAELLITLSFAATLGLLLARFFNKFRVPSKSFARLCTLLACILAYYTAWIGWIANFVIYFSHNRPLLSFFTPHRIYIVACAINDLGTWNLFGKPLNGTRLTCVWAAEFFTLFVLTACLVEWKTKRSAKESQGNP